MTALNITEAATVQMPMVLHAAEVGWTPAPPEDALIRRGGTAGLLFRGGSGGCIEPLPILG